MHQTKMWYSVIFLVIGFSSASVFRTTPYMSKDYNLTLTQDKSLNPFENIVFHAILTKKDGTFATEEITFHWTDNAIPQNSKTSVSSDGHSSFTSPYTMINAPNRYAVAVDCTARMQTIPFPFFSSNTNDANIMVFSWGLFIFPFFLAFVK